MRNRSIGIGNPVTRRYRLGIGDAILRVNGRADRGRPRVVGWALPTTAEQDRTRPAAV
jgi:hypothetical protein